MKSKLKKITYLVIGLLIAFLPTNTLIFNEGAQNELSIPKQSAGYSESFIHVDGNWTDTTSNEWCYGSGTWQEPYVIENVTIDAPTGSGIFINNSLDDYFIIKNCTIINAQGVVAIGYGAGINLENCSRGVIFNNTIANTGTDMCGIQLQGYNCYNITIERNVVKSIGFHAILTYGGNNISILNNTVNSIDFQGIYLYRGCKNSTIAYNYVEDANLVHDSNQDAGIRLLDLNTDNNKIFNNTVLTCWRGMDLRDSSNNSIYNNTMKNNYNAGIVLSTNSNDNNVTNNIVSNDFGGSNQDYGIWLAGSSYNKITYNTANNNQAYGIFFQGSDNNSITENTVNDNAGDGIYLQTDCDNNNIINNTANDNTGDGIYLQTDCDNNNIINNTANDNTGHGINLDDNCDNNNITENTINDNTGHGINLDDNCDNNNIINNTANDNTGDGIYLFNSDYIDITDNTINDNTGHGLYAAGGSNDIKIINNTANNNTVHGIYLYNFDYSNITDNTINDNTDIGIYLRSFSDNNVIKNNSINRNDLGIALDQSNYNNISGNTLKDNSWCIYEYNSFGNIIEYNDCSPPTVQVPIFIDATATGVGANNWTWAVSQSWCSGSGTWNDPYIIENLKISGFGAGYGIYIYNSDVSFIIQDCLIYNSHEGIYLENVNNSRLINNNCSNIGWGILLEYSNNNTISGNTANGNIYEGIYLTECMGNTLSGNTANDNGDIGIHLHTECMNNTLSGNTANNNYDGISLDEFCNNNFVGGNTANDNDRVGIYLYYSNYNNITGNTASGNTYNGIYLDDGNNNNIIAGNIFNNNNIGIEIYYSDFNSIIGNTANDNNFYGITIEGSNNNTISGNRIYNNKDTGIRFNEDCEDNVITENTLRNNSLGIHLYSDCSNNSIYKNFFLENGKHAEDDGTDNMWNSTTIGNYWDNWTSPDVSPNDGIVDVPYIFIGGPAGSIDYLPIAEDGAPSITINSPTSSDVFAVTAPSFDVTITDIYVDSMWYTLDGGINNYTFIENGIINQTAWAAKTQGSVTITFYASDIIGNIGIAEVSLAKDTTAPIIVINSPTDGEEFGTQAPLFNITVTEINLDVMEYSFDGGITTYVFTNNTVFNQTAWTALPEGDVTITFYARDLAGNEASEAVTVVKTAAGLDPGIIIIIIIVVVSISGGVAVAAVIFIYLKKRASPK